MAKHKGYGLTMQVGNSGVPAPATNMGHTGMITTKDIESGGLVYSGQETNINAASRFEITSSGAAEMNEVHRMSTQTNGGFGMLNIDPDSFWRKSKGEMKEVVKSRLIEQHEILPPWECDNEDQVVGFAGQFSEQMQAKIELLKNLESGGTDRRYDGIALIGSEATFTNCRFVQSKRFKPRSIVLIRIGDSDGIANVFAKSSVGQIALQVAPDYSPPGWRVAAECYSFVMGVGARTIVNQSHKAVPEYDLYFDWCCKRSIDSRRQLEECGRNVSDFMELFRSPPLVICQISGAKKEVRQICPSSQSGVDLIVATNMLRIICLAEYIAHRFNTPFVHYQTSL